MTGKSEIERFSRDLASSESLRNEMKAIGVDNEAAVRFANTKGYQFSMADVSALAPRMDLSDDQLEQAVGGAGTTGFARIIAEPTSPSVIRQFLGSWF